MSHRVIAERVIGKRMIAGTEWTIRDVLQREECDGRVEWVVYRSLCNGAWYGREEYRTRREAVAAVATASAPNAAAAMIVGKDAIHAALAHGAPLFVLTLSGDWAQAGPGALGRALRKENMDGQNAALWIYGVREDAVSDTEHCACCRRRS